MRNLRLSFTNIELFDEMEIPMRGHIVEPWFPEKGLVMLVAPRGIGKTLFTLSLCHAIASGGKFLNWEIKEPRHLLYIDGEMPAHTMQSRIKAIGKGMGKLADPSYFQLMLSDMNEDGIPDLATAEGQKAIDLAVKESKAEIIVLDNLSCLIRTGKENEAESWVVVQDWLLSHRRAGRSIFMVHHTGKNGMQRGTSKREDMLDTVISLKRPANYTADQGARFEIHFDKSRGFHGEPANPFEAQYQESHGKAIWLYKSLVNGNEHKVNAVKECINDGLSIRETSKKLKMSVGNVHKLKQQAFTVHSPYREECEQDNALRA